MEKMTILCLILIVQSCLVYAEEEDGYEAEADALLEFKGSLSGGGNTLSTWNVSSPKAPCDWAHIGCDYQGYVSAINLARVGIGGPINGVALTKLSSLVHLDLTSNNMSGSIPEAFQDISFDRLILNNNQISGTIPCSLGKKHQIRYSLQLKNNNLEGCKPKHLVNATRNYFDGNPKLCKCTTTC